MNGSRPGQEAPDAHAPAAGAAASHPMISARLGQVTSVHTHAPSAGPGTPIMNGAP